ncbi:hypothetical protein FWH58_00655 [Candidatus Saccharibacteria bacterium]|nr:hypothetical protein [Candidatus Saccharibacteria bacterium]
MNQAPVQSRIDIEREGKFWGPPETLDKLGNRYQTQQITQLYLSTPGDEFELRVRRTVLADNTESCTATLKSRPEFDGATIERLEMETEIAKETYEYWSQQGLPVVEKTRCDYGSGLTVDWIKGIDAPLIELEARTDCTMEELIRRTLAYEYLRRHCRPADDSAFSENIAHRGLEWSETAPLTVADIINPLINGQINPSIDNPYIIAIAGRSGSGKSTIAHQVQEELENRQISAQIVCVDDYIKGLAWLQDQLGDQPLNYDLPGFFDTSTCARELSERIELGTPLPEHRYNWNTQEPDPVKPVDTLSPVIILEGIYADSPDLADVVNVLYTVPTGVATCVGRRLARSLSGEQLGGLPPEDQLRYYLTSAEPTYRQAHGLSQD